MPSSPPSPRELFLDTKTLYALLNDGDDVAVVVVGISYLDACLGSLLQSRLRKGSTSDQLLDARGGPLGSFAVRAKLAYAMKVIEKPILQDLLTLAQVRNDFAHTHFERRFVDKEVAAHCSNLRYIESIKDTSGVRTFIRTKLTKPRDRFMVSVITIMQYILTRALKP